MKEPIIIKDIPKSNGETLRIEISEYKGVSYLNLKIKLKPSLAPLGCLNILWWEFYFLLHCHCTSKQSPADRALQFGVPRPPAPRDLYL